MQMPVPCLFHALIPPPRQHPGPKCLDLVSEQICCWIFCIFCVLFSMPRFPHAPCQPASQHASVLQCPGMARALAATLLLLVKAHHYYYQISTLYSPQK